MIELMPKISNELLGNIFIYTAGILWGIEIIPQLKRLYPQSV
jgi:hypothetical protein